MVSGDIIENIFLRFQKYAVDNEDDILNETFILLRGIVRKYPSCCRGAYKRAINKCIRCEPLFVNYD
jgi:hypothetical protein